MKEIPIIGPSAAGAQLEGSKAFVKEFMGRHAIPTAAYKSFSKDQLEEALVYLATHTLPVVLKADGLAAGKGVLICNTLAEAQQEIEEKWYIGNLAMQFHYSDREFWQGSNVRLSHGQWQCVCIVP